MRRLGLLVLLAGIGVALFLYLPAPVDSGSSLDKPQPIAAARGAELGPNTIPAVRGTSGHIEVSQNPASAPAPTAAPVTAEVPSTWQTGVSVESPNTTSAVVPKTLSPTDPDARYKLVLEIQRHLKRVGCYWGRIDGSWGTATMNAMREFTNRVNATLPLDAPDYVQLSLIQSHADKACGACPAGQLLSASGRCMGLPITVQAKQPNASQLATEQKEVLPWRAASGSVREGGPALFRPAPTTGASTEPLPERMAIGGPNPISIDVEQSAPRVSQETAAPVAAATTSALDPNAPAVKPSTTITPYAQGRSSNNHHRRFAGDAPRQRGSGRERLSLPRRNLMLSLGGVY
jgi:hypothetical protein